MNKDAAKRSQLFAIWKVFLRLQAPVHSSKRIRFIIVLGTTPRFKLGVRSTWATGGSIYPMQPGGFSNTSIHRFLQLDLKWPQPKIVARPLCFGRLHLNIPIIQYIPVGICGIKSLLGDGCSNNHSEYRNSQILLANHLQEWGCAATYSWLWTRRI